MIQNASQSNILVERDLEMAQLRAGVDQSISGRGRLFLLTGEPGIGKTRLADELASYADSRGMRVLWGRCEEGEDTPAFWPWIQILRGCVRQGLTTESSRQIEAEIENFDYRLPELPDSQLLTTTSFSDAAREHPARFRMFDWMANFLRSTARTQPLLLVVDDLHWSDEPTSSLLRFLARALRDAAVMTLVTCRDVEVRFRDRMAGILRHLARECSHVPIRPLDERGVSEMITGMSGRPPSASLVTAVHRATGGNPLFVREISTGLFVNQSSAAFGAGSAAFLDRGNMSATVRSTIRARLSSVSRDTERILRLAAIFGGEFDLLILEDVSEVGSEDLLEALAEAESAGIIREVAGSPGRYRFVHGLVRDQLYDDFPLTSRIRLHQRIAEALERLSPTSSEAHLAEIAYHYFESRRLGTARQAFDYAQRAADRALTASLFDDAIRLYRMAIAAWDLLPASASDYSQRCDLLLSLADAQHKEGAEEAARSSLREAAAISERNGDPQRFARAALGFPAAYWPSPKSSEAGLVLLLRRALSMLDAGSSGLRAMLLARLAAELPEHGSVRQKRGALMAEAVTIARQSGDREALLYILSYRDWLLSGPALIDERLGNAAEILSISQATENYACISRSALSRAVSFLRMGEVERADLEAQSLEFVAKQVRQPSLEWRAYCFTAARLIMEGRFDKGEEFARRCIALGEQFDNREMGRHFWCTMLAPFGERGRIQELEEAALKAVDERPEDITFKAFLSYLYCELDQLPKARLYFEELMAKDLTEFASDDDFVGTLAALAHVCASLRDKAQAAKLYDLLLPYATRNVMVGPAAVFGSASRYLGLLSATLGRVEEALGHFEFALRFNQKTGAQPWGAYTRYDWARVLVEQGDPAMRPEALDLVRSAAESAQALGLKRLLERAKALELKAAQPVAAGERQNFAGEKPAPAPIIAGNSAEKAIVRAVSSPVSPNRVFRREGDYWTISYEGATVRLRHSKGLALIAHLIRYPFQDFHVADLAESFGGGSDGRLAADDAASWDGGEPDPVLDATAKSAFKRRLEELRDDLEVAKSLNDPDRAGKLEEEIDYLTEELSRSVGLGGRDRYMYSTAERARVRITNAIKAAEKKILDQNAKLGRYLARTIRTGAFCSYMPDSDGESEWHF
jgi:tetratricopeptide (TPR) repeat protein